MPQSNVIFAFIFFAYLFFITARGELGTYIQILRGGGAQPATASGSGNADGLGNFLTDPGQIINPDGTASDASPSPLLGSDASTESNPLDVFSSGAEDF